MRLLALALLLAGCTTAAATTGTAWHRVPQSSFVSFGPIVQRPRTPDRLSGDAGSTPAGIATPAPSVRTEVLPPALGARGWATYQPGTGLWASPSGYIRNWPGTWVKVCGPVACRRIELRNECACGDRHGLRTLLDLSVDAWVAVCGSDTGQGICLVQVTRP